MSRRLVGLLGISGRVDLGKVSRKGHIMTYLNAYSGITGLRYYCEAGGCACEHKMTPDCARTCTHRATCAVYRPYPEEGCPALHAIALIIFDWEVRADIAARHAALEAEDNEREALAIDSDSEIGGFRRTI